MNSEVTAVTFLFASDAKNVTIWQASPATRGFRVMHGPLDARAERVEMLD